MSSRTNRRVYFTIVAPKAGSVRVFGSFDDWSGRDLKPTSKGVWRTWMSLAPGRYEYRFLVDGQVGKRSRGADDTEPFRVGEFGAGCRMSRVLVVEEDAYQLELLSAWFHKHYYVMF